MRPIGPEPRSTDENGQYMVEFALTFTVFMFFIFVVIDMGLMIYNHNLFYNAVYRGAREAALGGDNAEIRNAVEEIAAENYFPSLLMIARPEEGVQIQPPSEIDRVQGETVRVSMRTTFGLNLLGVVPMTMTFPISSEELVHVHNDNDRDGLKDELEAHPRDHDNDGTEDQYLFGGNDGDADDDGASAGSDTVAIAYITNDANCTDGFWIYRPNNPANGPTCNPTWWNAGDWEGWFDGDYHAPEVWDNGRDAPPKLFPRQLPTWHVDESNLTPDTHVRILRTEHDSDNDGWIDKYDEADNDTTTH